MIDPNIHAETARQLEQAIRDLAAEKALAAEKVAHEKAEVQLGPLAGLAQYEAEPVKSMAVAFKVFLDGGEVCDLATELWIIVEQIERAARGENEK